MTLVPVGKLVGIGDSELSGGTRRRRRPWLESLSIEGVEFSDRIVRARPVATIEDIRTQQLDDLDEITALVVVTAGGPDIGFPWVLARDATRLPFWRLTKGEANRRASAAYSPMVGLLKEVRRRARNACVVLLRYAPRPFGESRVFTAGAAARMRYGEDRLGLMQEHAARAAGVWFCDPTAEFAKYGALDVVHGWVWPWQKADTPPFHLTAAGERLDAIALARFLERQLAFARPQTRFRLPSNPFPMPPPHRV